MGPLQQYLNGPQFNWAPNNNIDPRGPGPFNLILPTNLIGPPTIILIQGVRGPLNLIFANQFKRITRVKLSFFSKKLPTQVFI